MGARRLASPRWRRLRGAAAVSLACAAIAQPAWPAAQTFNTALPVAKGEFIFREQFIARRLEQSQSAGDPEVNVLGGASVLGYGVTGKWAVFGVAPVLHKELEVSRPGGRVSRDTGGLADSRVFARYTVFQDDAPGRTFRIAPFGGVKAPAGDDDERDGLGELPRMLQLGSGSWDAFGGVVTTYQTLAFQVDASASYQENTEARGFEFGDEARFDGSFQYRVWPRRLRGGVPGFLYAVAEANLILRGRNRVQGLPDPDSGGSTLLIAPGLQYVTRRWVLEGVVQIPVHQDPNGLALEDDYTLRAGFRFSF